MKIPAAILLLNLVVVLANENVEQFVRSNLEFSSNIYKELAADHSGNFVVCPMSSQLVLSMVHAGAKQETATQLLKGLSLTNSSTKINAVISDLLPKLESSPTYTLKTVNKMYLSDDIKIKNEFKSTIVDVFKAGVENIDFKQKDQAITKMNTWVADQTENRIKNLIEPADVSDLTKSVLLNALYFQGTWSKKFDEQSTKKKTFQSPKLGDIEVDMMETTGSFEYRQCGFLKAKFLRMPYVGGDNLRMVVVLPYEKDGLAHIEENIETALGAPNYRWQKVHVNFPKFTMDSSLKMVPTLEKMGIVDVFKPSADLSGIAEGVALYVSNVVQKNVVEVNEKGTIAASATAALVGVGSSFNPEPPQEFIADHPFLYFIESDAGILFVGRFAGH